MSAVIPESHKQLLTGPTYVVLTTLMPDNQPQSTVVWADYDGEHVIVNTAAGRQKARNMEARPNVSVLAIDTSKPYYWIEVRGTAELTEEGGVEGIDQLARKYMNVPEYYGPVAPAEQRDKETRLVCKINPTHVVAFGG